MSRTNHEFNSQIKDSIRKSNVEFVQKHASMLIDDAGLVGPWCELVGATGHLSLEHLLRTKLVSQNQFIGIDKDSRIIAKHRRAYPNQIWKTGDFFVVHSALPPIAILNLDGYDSAGKASDLIHIGSIARRALKTYGGFAFIYNVELTLASIKNGGHVNTVKKHAKALVNVINHWCDFTQIAMSSILPSDNIPKEGTIGAFTIYKGEKTKMINFRIVLH